MVFSSRWVALMVNSFLVGHLDGECTELEETLTKPLVHAVAFPYETRALMGRSSKSEGAQEIEGELHVSYRLSGVISGRQASFSFSMAVYSYQFMATRMLQESKVERPLDFMSHLPSVGIGAPSAGVGSACHQVVKARKAVALFLWKNRFDPGDPNSPRGFFVTYPLHEAKSDMSMWPYVQSTERMRERERGRVSTSNDECQCVT